MASEDSHRVLSVRLILAARDAVHRHLVRTLLVLLALAFVVWLGSGIYVVGSGEEAALRRFGALVDDAIGPGLGVRLPGMHALSKVRTSEVSRLELGAGVGEELQLVTGDENLITAVLVVQYRVRDLGDYLFATEDPATLVAQTVQAALLRSFVATPVDEVLTSAKTAIQEDVRQAAQERLEAYGAGVTLLAVSLQSVSPPTEADSAFRAVSDARAEAARSVSVAEGDREKSLGLARGQAGRSLSEARSGAEARRQDAQGRADRFRALYERGRRAPEQLRSEMWNNTVREVLPKARLIFLQPGEDPKVHVYLLPRSDEPPKRTEPLPKPPVENP